MHEVKVAVYTAGAILLGMKTKNIKTEDTPLVGAIRSIHYSNYF